MSMGMIAFRMWFPSPPYSVYHPGQPASSVGPYRQVLHLRMPCFRLRVVKVCFGQFISLPSEGAESTRGCLILSSYPCSSVLSVVTRFLHFSADYPICGSKPKAARIDTIGVILSPRAKKD